MNSVSSKQWREVKNLEDPDDCSAQFAAECEESESDGESVIGVVAESN